MTAAVQMEPLALSSARITAEINRGMSSVRARTAEIDRCLRGAPSEDMIESARRRLGELMEAAAALRARLPDRDGLRTGHAAQRAVRALSVLATGFARNDGFSPQQVSALLEVTPDIARAWLFRARIKGWVREGAPSEGFTADRPWILTEAGKAFAR